MTLYLKYRPQTLDALAGQDNVKKTLAGAYLAGKLSHAYLLVGPRGTGKTSTARILAKMVNCERVQTNNLPCNKCTTCLSITDGSNLDLIEIDAASNRGIDDIRTLRENIKLSPAQSSKKVYIIDEVHMLTAEAFNALLKTLEEPPSHALFILATTQGEKIPSTILSRVQRLDFKLADAAELLQFLQKVAKEEKINIDDEALQILARASDGSFRDGVKLLDQVSSSSNQITADVVAEILRAIKFESMFDIIEKIASNDVKTTILKITKQIELGADPKQLNVELLGILRKLLLIKNDLGKSLVEPQYSTDQYQLLKSLADKLSISYLAGALDILQQAGEKMKFSSIPSLPLELAVMEICSPDKSENRTGQSSEQQVSVSVVQKEVSDTPIHRNTETPISSDLSDTPNSSDILKLNEKWTFVLETIRPFNFSLEALLRSVKVADCSDGIVILEVPYSFHQRILEAPKSRDLLESVFSDILGKSVKVSTVLGIRPQKIEDVVNVEVAADDEIIRVASEIFEGRLVD